MDFDTNIIKAPDTLSVPSFTTAGLSDIGKVRERNEDNFCIDEEIGLFAVSDGIGGHKGGEKASAVVAKILPVQMKIALDELKAQGSKLKRREELSTSDSQPSIQQEREISFKTRIMEESEDSLAKSLESDELGFLKSALDKAIRHMSRQINRYAQEIPELKGAGATIVACLGYEKTAIIAHLGDSRAYLMRKGKLTRLTEDHSLVELMLKLGQISKKQAKNHPSRHTITRYVGMDQELSPDMQVIELEEGDRILLCSDGLTNMIPEKKIGTVIKREHDLKKICKELIDTANKAGGTDNITVVIIQYGKN